MSDSKPLKVRSDGNINISINADAVSALDEVTETLSTKLGFKVTRSQTIRHLIHAYKQVTS